MKENKHMKTITNIICPAFSLFAVACFALVPQARATCQDACSTNNNTVQGDDALINNTTGRFNTALGAHALDANTTGQFNTATGNETLEFNTGGGGNTATGYIALLENTTGSNNTAIGGDALFENTTGSNNTAIGVNALFFNITGSNNIAVGFNVASTLRTGDNNIYIGNLGRIEEESRRIRIGTVGVHETTLIAGISAVTVPDGVGVIVGNNGKLGTVVSSARFKETIKPMDKASEAILQLKPVTFRYKKDLDPNGIPQFGLVAEDVEKVNPDLVARDDQGKPYTVRYEAVNAMLLNEFLKEHKAFVLEQDTVARLKAVVVLQQKQIEALTAGLQKVSAQLELSKTAPQTVSR